MSVWGKELKIWKRFQGASTHRVDSCRPSRRRIRSHFSIRLHTRQLIHHRLQGLCTKGMNRDDHAASTTKTWKSDNEDIYLFIFRSVLPKRKGKKKERNGFAVRSILSWWVVKLSKPLKKYTTFSQYYIDSASKRFGYNNLSLPVPLAHTCSCALMYEDKFITHLNTNYCCDDELEDVLFAATASKRLHLSTEA